MSPSKSIRRPKAAAGSKPRAKAQPQGTSVFRLCTTSDALSQAISSVRVCIQIHHVEEDPSVVFGRFIGYGGGAGQEEGCFKLIRSANAFFLSRSGEDRGGLGFLIACRLAVWPSSHSRR